MLKADVARCQKVFEEVRLPKQIVAHSKKVAKIAKRLALAASRRGADVDVGLVEIGALLHDVGRAKTHSLAHGVIGGRMVRRMGFGEEVARIVERHVVSGLTAKEAKRMGLPARNYVPETLEEKIVCYADKLSDKDKTRRIIKKCGTKSNIAKRLKALFDEMGALLGKA